MHDINQKNANTKSKDCSYKKVSSLRCSTLFVKSVWINMETGRRRENKDNEVKEKEDVENTIEVELGQAMVNRVELENHTEESYRVSWWIHCSFGGVRGKICHHIIAWKIL